jgi:PLP dependent protein
LLPITKGVDAQRLSLAFAAGMHVFGENRVQEAEAKVGQLEGARWQLVGHLQSNKARRAVEIFEQIHSVDSLALAARLDALLAERDGDAYGVYLQVNVDRDPAKAGFDPAALDTDVGRLADLRRLRLLGLMTVGRLTATADQARSTFVRLRELSTRLRRAEPRLGAGLSMGMSDDFELAVEEGATVVRVGRAIFGERTATG